MSNCFNSKLDVLNIESKPSKRARILLRPKNFTCILTSDEIRVYSKDDVKIKLEEFIFLKCIGRGAFGKVILVEKQGKHFYNN